ARARRPSVASIDGSLRPRSSPSTNQSLRAPEFDFRILFAYSFRFFEGGWGMDEKALYLKFWEKEAPATRKVLARIPQAKSDYRADPKARNARDIAWLIVQEEISLVEALEKSRFEWVELPTPGTVQEILSTYDQRHDDLTARLRTLDAHKLEGPVPFIFNGEEAFRDTGFALAWGVLFDLIHHRGQLSTYLRPMGSTVPAIYGP